MMEPTAEQWRIISQGMEMLAELARGCPCLVCQAVLLGERWSRGMTIEQLETLARIGP